MKQEHEFEQFLQVHANKELTTDERTQLGVLAMQDPERQLTVAEFEELHRRMDEERRLAAAVMAPASPSEETEIPVVPPELETVNRADVRVNTSVPIPIPPFTSTCPPVKILPKPILKSPPWGLRESTPGPPSGLRT